MYLNFLVNTHLFCCHGAPYLLLFTHSPVSFYFLQECCCCYIFYQPEQHTEDQYPWLKLKWNGKNAGGLKYYWSREDCSLCWQYHYHEEKRMTILYKWLVICIERIWKGNDKQITPLLPIVWLELKRLNPYCLISVSNTIIKISDLMTVTNKFTDNKRICNKKIPK